nr:adenylyl-sulfate kinase [uncultured Rhodopila sp.]
MPGSVVRVMVCGSDDDHGSSWFGPLLPTPGEAGSRPISTAETDDSQRFAERLITEAFTYDVVLLLVDGRTGIQPETRRFAAIASLAGIPQAIVAVLGADQAAFESIVREFSALAPKLAFQRITPIPLGLSEDGVAGEVAWYAGPSLREVLLAADNARPRLEKTAEPAAADGIDARVVWTHETPLFRGRAYLLILGGRTVTATVIDIATRLDPETLDDVSVRELAQGDIGQVSLSLTHPLECHTYAENPEHGGVLLVDRLTREAVGAGFVTAIRARNADIVWHRLDVDKAARSLLKDQKPAVLWFTGLSGAGKSTIANLVEKRLHALGHHTMILDGDNVRHGLNRDLGFSEADRVENIRRIAEVSRLFVEAGLIVLVSFISPYRAERMLARDRVGEGEFLEIFVDTPIGECRRRDPKGLYEKADSGLIRNFTGVDAPYEEPDDPEIQLRTLEGSAEALADEVVAALRARGNIA